MTVQTLRIFTCDRCRQTAEKDTEVDPSWQPMGWAAAIRVRPPLAGLDASDVKRITLCNPCLKAFDRFCESVGQDKPVRP